MLASALALSACTGNSLSSAGLPQTPQTQCAPAGSYDDAQFAIRDDDGMPPIAHTHGMHVQRDDGFAACAFSRASSLRYHNGSVQTSPSIYLVFWGFQTFGDRDGEATRLIAFMNAIGASSWLNTVTQYYQSGPSYVANTSGQLAGTWYDDANPVPVHPRDRDVKAEAIRLAQHFNAVSSQAAYIVATPSGRNIRGFPRNYCAYHGDTAGGRVPYTNLPYISDGAQGCGANAVNAGTAGKIDGVTIVAGHELAETQTDPAGGGWYDASGNEIGDKCAWRRLQNTSFGSFGTFPTQPLWSNANGGCVQ